MLVAFLVNDLSHFTLIIFHLSRQFEKRLQFLVQYLNVFHAQSSFCLGIESLNFWVKISLIILSHILCTEIFLTLKKYSRTSLCDHLL